MPNQVREIQTHPSYRLAELTGVNRRAGENEGDEEIVTIELSFSSEYGVERFDYWDGDYIEVLDHDPASVRLDRINGGAPFLMDHDTRHQAGVIKGARIEGGRGLATIQLSRNARNLPGYGDVIADFEDGVRTLVSVGYRIYRAVLAEENSEGPNTYRMVDWEPFEISSVPVPADPSVGIDRAAMEQRGNLKPNTLIIEGTRTMDNDEKTMQQMIDESLAQRAAESQEQTTTATQLANLSQRDESTVNVSEVRTQERSRISAISEAETRLAAIPGVNSDELAELAREHKNGDSTPGEFYVKAMERFGDKMGVAETSESGNIGMNQREKEKYSLFRAVNLMDKMKNGTANPADMSRAGLEIEVAQAAAEKRGEKRQPSGMLIPDDILTQRSIPVGILGNGVRMALAVTRDLSVGGANGALNMVDTVLDMASFIEILRANLILERLGTRVITGLVGDLAIPRQTGGVSTFWVGEGGDITRSDPTFDTVTLTPHTLGAAVDITRKTLIQTDAGIAEAITMADMAAQVAQEINRVGIHGDPATVAAEPLGVLNVTGIGAVAGAGLTRNLLVNLEGEVAVDNALVGSLGFLTNTKVRQGLKLAKTDAGSGQFVWPSGAMELEGYNAVVSNLVSRTLGVGNDMSAMIFGNWDDQMLGLWSGLDINLDSASLSLSGGLRIVAHQDVDFAYRHPESFAAAVDLDAG